MPEYPKTENLPTTLHRLETRLYYDYSRITVDIEKTGGEVTVGELPPTRILGEAVRIDDDPVRGEPYPPRLGIAEALRVLAGDIEAAILLLQEPPADPV